VTRAVLPAEDLAGDSDASFTQAGSMLGTLCYMPPEQAAGEVARIGPPSDVFGLGAILAVILTGQPPYDGADTETIRVMALRGDLAACRARLDACAAEPELVALCKRCLAFDPADRPPPAGAVADEVAALRAASEERARAAEKERAAAEARAAEQRLRRRWQAALAAAVVLIVALLAGGAWWADRQAADRDKEHAVAAERDRQEAAAALAHAEEVLAAGDLDVVEQALAIADKRLGAGAADDLAARLATARRECDLVRELREIDELGWLPGGIAALKPAQIAARYRAAFTRYGLDVGTADPATAAQAVGKSRVAPALALGLSEWFCAEPDTPQLGVLLDRFDPAPDRAALRAAIRAGDQDKVRAQCRALDGSTMPTWFIASIGNLPIVPADDGVRLMAAAWRTHPADYVLAFRCARRLVAAGRPDELLAWAKVAVALRPRSRFA
jgi:hypothetical protein